MGNSSFDFKTAEALIELAYAKQMTVPEIMIQREVEMFGRTREESLAKMRKAWDIMKSSTEAPLKKPIKSMGGLIGGEAKKLLEHEKRGESLCSGLVHKAMRYAMAVMELNASMGLIVAAPTAGSSGVVPGVLRAMQEVEGYSDEQMVEALFVAGAIGYLITLNATVAGAEGGCQAEVGAATAMAAAALTYLRGEGPAGQVNAASLALGNLLGLVCDPILGLVESPCQQRNAQGATGAITAAELSLAGVETQVPLDEMIGIMYAVGKALPEELRETALGGMASAKKFCNTCA